MDPGDGWSPPTDALVSTQLNQLLLGFTQRRNLCKKTMRLEFRVSCNKGAGVGQNKGGYLEEETEACWVIERGGGQISSTTLGFVCRGQSHCCVRSPVCGSVAMWSGGYSYLVMLGNCV